MIYGHTLIRDMLARAVSNLHLHHALLFWGAPGVGKYTLALELIRLLNCERPEQSKPCGQCNNCRRIDEPFPFHPDVQILRDITTPLFLSRAATFRRYQYENGIPEDTSTEAIQTEYLDGLNVLTQQGVLSTAIACTNADPPLDILHFSKDKKISPALMEKSAAQPMTSWLYKKLQMYHESYCYDRSIKIESIREIQKVLYLHPYEGNVKAVLIDDADRMLPPAQNCLLKVLEEPPGNSILILIVNHPKGLLPTIRSRCQIIPFYRLSHDALIHGLREKFGFSAESAAESSLYAQGSFSAAVGTNWQMETQCQQVCDKLFDAAGVQDVDWVLNASREILSMDSTGEMKGLSRLYRWLHDKVCSEPDKETISGSLPGNRPFTIDVALKIMDGINDIIAQSVYHTDTRLQLESRLLRILKDMD